MSDDFGTVNVSKADRAREIDALRQQYGRHREWLQKLIADAPNEHLATEYRRLLGEIDAALLKVNDLLPGNTAPAMRPLDHGIVAYEEVQRDSRSRLAWIAVAALIALAAIGWLIWKASSDRAKPGAIAEQTTTTTTTAAAAPSTIAEEPPPPPAVADVLTVSPASADYGTIRKGTRATRQFDVKNGSDQPVTIQVARSACRCLFYEYRDLVPPKGKETVTVTIDGARAKAGALHETVKVTAKKDASITTSFDVTSNIR